MKQYHDQLEKLRYYIKDTCTTEIYTVTACCYAEGNSNCNTYITIHIVSRFNAQNMHKTKIITSGKNFIKITSVGMGSAKSNETR